MAAALRKFAPSLLLTAALVLSGAAFGVGRAYADDEGSSVKSEEAADWKAIDEKLEGIALRLQEVDGKIGSQDGGEPVVSAQVIADFYFVEVAICVLLALDLGALCWLCFRAR